MAFTSGSALESLEEDIILIILSLMNLSDVLRVRLTCKSLYRATKDKLLWIYILRHLVVNQGVPLPPYCKSIELLDATQIEAIAVRVACLGRAWHSRRLVPRTFSRMDLPRSVSWLRLVARWLFVASSDTSGSSFACYDIGSVLSNNTEPVAECFLSGPVHTADIEIQDEGVVIALAVGSLSPVVEIILLAHVEGQLVFVQLASLAGLSHIRLLHGDLIGCAMSKDISIPHLVNWRTKATYALAELPDENGCCLAIAFWQNYLVLARPYDIQLFSAPTATSPPHHLQTVGFELFAWDVIIVGQSRSQSSLKGLFVPAPQDDTNGTIEFLVTAEDNAYLYSLSADTLTMNVRHGYFERHEWPLRIRVGASGLRMAWISGQHGTGPDESPILIASRLHHIPDFGYGQTPPDGSVLGLEVNIGDPSNFPCLWALASFDFDEVMGLLAVGNIFGELALCDYVGSPALDDMAIIGVDFTKRQAFNLHIMPQDPVGMDIAPVAHFWPDGSPFNDEQESIVTQLTSAWYRIPDADVPPGWSNDWDNWNQRWAWQGLPGDSAWILEHSLHFLGRPEPLLRTRWATLFRAGGLYFIRNLEDDVFVIDNKLSLETILANLREDDQTMGSSAKARSETGQNDAIQFLQIWDRECACGRNRWAEQLERGGKPHPFLLSESPIDTDDGEQE